LLFEVALELLSLLGALFASVTTPDEKDDDEQEESAENDEEDLPPDKATTTTRVGWLLRVGVERWDDNRRCTTVVGDHDKFGKADTKARSWSGTISTIDIGANTSS